MTTNAAPADPTRRVAFAAGVLYLLTFIGSIPASLLLPPVLSGANYITGPGATAPIGLAAVLEMVNVLTCIGTAVAVFSVVKRQHESLALGFVATRLFEAGVIAIGVVSILAVAGVRQSAAAAADPASFVPVGTALVAVRDWAIVLGPGMASFNALMFGTLLFRARLVPRAIPALGLIGAPVFISFVIGTMLGITGPGTIWQGIAVAPFFFWELVVGLWMTFKGFNPDRAGARRRGGARRRVDRRGSRPRCRCGEGRRGMTAN
jgi:hypothetical protein